MDQSPKGVGLIALGLGCFASASAKRFFVGLVFSAATHWRVFDLFRPSPILNAYPLQHIAAAGSSRLGCSSSYYILLVFHDRIYRSAFVARSLLTEQRIFADHWDRWLWPRQSPMMLVIPPACWWIRLRDDSSLDPVGVDEACALCLLHAVAATCSGQSQELG